MDEGGRVDDEEAGGALNTSATRKTLMHLKMETMRAGDDGDGFNWRIRGTFAHSHIYNRSHLRSLSHRAEGEGVPQECAWQKLMQPLQSLSHSWGSAAPFRDDACRESSQMPPSQHSGHIFSVSPTGPHRCLLHELKRSARSRKVVPGQGAARTVP